MEGRDGESAREVGAEVEDELWRGGRSVEGGAKGSARWEGRHTVGAMNERRRVGGKEMGMAKEGPGDPEVRIRSSPDDGTNR